MNVRSGWLWFSIFLQMLMVENSGLVSLPSLPAFGFVEFSFYSTKINLLLKIWGNSNKFMVHCHDLSILSPTVHYNYVLGVNKKCPRDQSIFFKCIHPYTCKWQIIFFYISSFLKIATNVRVVKRKPNHFPHFFSK